MEGFPAGLVQDLAAERQAELARRLRRPVPAGGPVARRARGAGQARRPAIARRVGRWLVAMGVRLAGPDAAGGWGPLADATR